MKHFNKLGKLKISVDKKRSVIYSVVALMLCTAVYLNWDYTNDLSEVNSLDTKNYGDIKLVDLVESEDIVSVSSDDDLYATAKLTRQTSRDEAMSLLEETINNVNTTDEAKIEASAAVSVMSQNTLSEGAIETMMIAKGYDNGVVFITETGVNVLVSKEESEFTATDASIIKDIVISETGVSADKIKIVEGN